MRKRKLLATMTAIALCLLGRVPAVYAGAIQLTDVSQLTPDPTLVKYPVAPPNPFEVAEGSVLLTFSTPILFNEFVQDGSFAPEFPSDSTLLYNFLQGPLTIDFAPGVREVGFFAQGFSVGTLQEFAVKVFNGSSQLISFTVGPDPNAPFPGTALFIGARAFDLDLITQMTVRNTELSDDPSFVIGELAFSDGAVAEPVPEPASLFLLGTGLLGAGVRLRRGRTRAESGDVQAAR